MEKPSQLCCHVDLTSGPGSGSALSPALDWACPALAPLSPACHPQLRPWSPAPVSLTRPDRAPGISRSRVESNVGVERGQTGPINRISQILCSKIWTLVFNKIITWSRNHQELDNRREYWEDLIKVPFIKPHVTSLWYCPVTVLNFTGKE